MRVETCLLIDYENFFLNRERDHDGNYPEEAAEGDLEELVRFVRETYRDSRLNVRRAYADFTARRWLERERRTDFYLRDAPRWLMRFGIEPVQVFRFRRNVQSGYQPTKNSADIRMGMDAVRLMTDENKPAHFVLVTSDTDFVPVVHELRRMGAEVAAVGLRGSTSEALPAYCDRFIYFEDLIASRAAGRDSEAEELEANLPAVREALGSLLRTRGSLLFAAVQPALSRRLGNDFSPRPFGCETTSEFLKRYQDELGVRVVRGEHDLEIVPADTGLAQPSPAAAAPQPSPGLQSATVPVPDAVQLSGELAEVAGALSSVVRRQGRVKFAVAKSYLERELGRTFDHRPYGGERISDFYREHAARFGLRIERGEHDWELAPGGDETPIQEDAALRLYRDVLRRSNPPVFPLPRAICAAALERVVTLLSADTGALFPADELRNAVADHVVATIGDDSAEQRARQLILQLRLCGCLERKNDDTLALADGITDAAAIRDRLNRYLIDCVWNSVRSLGHVRLVSRAMAEVLLGEQPSDGVAQVAVWAGAVPCAD